MKAFSELDPREILALAIGLEEEHGRIYGEYAVALRESFPASAKVFDEMADGTRDGVTGGGYREAFYGGRDRRRGAALEIVGTRDE